MISARASRKVLKSTACFEAVKGLIGLLAAFGALALLGKDPEDLRSLASELVDWLNLDQEHYYPSLFIDAAARMTDTSFWLAASIGFLYALLRLLEAYGLWFERNWAAWLAVVSGGIYLPIEIYELARKFTWIRVSVLVLNLVVVMAMALVLWRNNRLAAEAAARAHCDLAEDGLAPTDSADVL